MNFQGDTHMVLAATVGHADAGVPALRNFFSGASQQIMQIRVSGNLQNPDIRQEVLARREPGIEELAGEPMSIGPFSGIAGSAAGTSLAQTRGSEIDRAQQESTARELRARSEQKAEMAAGVGQADGDNHQTAQRDADGRRLWEFPQRHRPAGGRPATNRFAPRAKTPPARAATCSI